MGLPFTTSIKSQLDLLTEKSGISVLVIAEPDLWGRLGAGRGEALSMCQRAEQKVTTVIQQTIANQRESRSECVQGELRVALGAAAGFLPVIKDSAPRPRRGQA